MIVYKVLNLVNGKVYVGQTRQPLAKRWMQHCYRASNCRGLTGAIRKHGTAAFEISVLATAGSQVELDALEITYIKQFNSLSPAGYNLTTGGEGGYARSDETKARLSRANKGKGRPHSAATKKKCSEGKLGSKNPSFGKPQTVESNLKRSAALKGKPRSAETKARISAGHKLRALVSNAASAQPSA